MPATQQHYKSFIAATQADTTIAGIEAEILKRNNGKRPVYSDLIKNENGRVYEYVDYVQEGGGVLGVALVGYTYVMEKMGFRFLKLAGTSAGAINTMMLAAVDKTNYKNEQFEYQSEIVLQEMLNYDLWQLVDGHWFAKWLIKIFVNKPFGKKLLTWLLACSVAIPVLYTVYALVIPRLITTEVLFSMGFQAFDNTLRAIATVAMLLFVFEVALILYFRYRFARAGYGINPGRKFHEWMNDILKRNHIHNSADLEAAMKKRTDDLVLRDERLVQNLPGDNTAIAKPYLTIVASDITTQTKVEFPLMAKDYWTDPNAVSPADFVRASMAIPVFFEPFKVEVKPQVQTHSRLQKMKANMADDTDNSSKIVSFVDGGILSNFPINVFHNPNIKVARLPTFGVKLEDEKHITDSKEQKEKPKLITFIGQVFSTIRFYYDRDFLKRNEIYEKTIAHVDVEGYNWLNFGMDYETKVELFKKGVDAARIFFLGGQIWVDGKERKFDGYDWQAFKDLRGKVVEEMKTDPAKQQ
jgi:NTE family protein